MSDITLDIKNGIAEQTSANSTTTSNNELGKDAFLKLLVCQMQNQDPLEPQADTAFVAQLATFSQLEQLQNINTTNSHSQAFSLVGKDVIVKKEDSSGNINYTGGTVEYATVQNNVAYLSIDGALYPMSQLERVVTSESTGMNSQAFSLIGQYVIMKSKDASGKDVFNDGRVDYITFKDGEAQLSIGEISYPISQLDKVIDNSYLSWQNSLVGKTVVVTSADANGLITEVKGKVEKLSVENGEVCLTVNGKNYPFSKLKEIITEPTEPTEPTEEP